VNSRATHLDHFIRWAQGYGLDVQQSDSPDRMFVDDRVELAYLATQEVPDRVPTEGEDGKEPQPELPTAVFAISDLTEVVRRFPGPRERALQFKTVLHRYARQAIAARQVAQNGLEAEPLFLGQWHHGEGNLCCGTMRYMRADFDTQPAQEIRTAVFDWICSTMNSALNRWRQQQRARTALESGDGQTSLRPPLQRFATSGDANLAPSDFMPHDTSKVGAHGAP
jgi:hypothetical protein